MQLRSMERSLATDSERERERSPRRVFALSDVLRCDWTRFASASRSAKRRNER